VVRKPALFGLAGQEDPIMRDEHVVEYDYTDRLAVFGRELGRSFAGTSGRTRDDRHAGRVHGNRAAHRKVLVLRSVGPAGHHQELVHIGRAGHDRLGAADDDTVRPARADMYVDIRIELLAWPFRAIALCIGHRNPQREIAVLYVVKIIEETLAVVAAMTIVGQFGGLVETVEGIVAEVALRAPGCPTDQAYRLQFIEQIGGVLVDVQHAVDRLAGRSLPCRHDREVLLLMRKVIGDADAGDTGSKKRFVSDALDGVSVDEDTRLVRSQRLAVVGGSLQHGALQSLFVLSNSVRF
jgi:hypothetical protein